MPKILNSNNFSTSLSEPFIVNFFLSLVDRFEDAAQSSNSLSDINAKIKFEQKPFRCQIVKVISLPSSQNANYTLQVSDTDCIIQTLITEAAIEEHNSINDSQELESLQGGIVLIKKCKFEFSSHPSTKLQCSLKISSFLYLGCAGTSIKKSSTLKYFHEKKDVLRILKVLFELCTDDLNNVVESKTTILTTEDAKKVGFPIGEHPEWESIPNKEVPPCQQEILDSLSPRRKRVWKKNEIFFNFSSQKSEVNTPDNSEKNTQPVSPYTFRERSSNETIIHSPSNSQIPQPIYINGKSFGFEVSDLEEIPLVEDEKVYKPFIVSTSMLIRKKLDSPQPEKFYSQDHRDLDIAEPISAAVDNEKSQEPRDSKCLEKLKDSIVSSEKVEKIETKTEEKNLFASTNNQDFVQYESQFGTLIFQSSNEQGCGKDEDSASFISQESYQIDTVSLSDFDVSNESPTFKKKDIQKGKIAIIRTKNDVEEMEKLSTQYDKSSVLSASSNIIVSDEGFSTCISNITACYSGDTCTLSPIYEDTVYSAECKFIRERSPEKYETATSEQSTSIQGEVASLLSGIYVNETQIANPTDGVLSDKIHDEFRDNKALEDDMISSTLSTQGLLVSRESNKKLKSKTISPEVEELTFSPQNINLKSASFSNKTQEHLNEKSFYASDESSAETNEVEAQEAVKFIDRTEKAQISPTVNKKNSKLDLPIENHTIESTTDATDKDSFAVNLKKVDESLNVKSMKKLYPSFQKEIPILDVNSAFSEGKFTVYPKFAPQLPQADSMKMEVALDTVWDNATIMQANKFNCFCNKKRKRACVEVKIGSKKKKRKNNENITLRSPRELVMDTPVDLSETKEPVFSTGSTLTTPLVLPILENSPAFSRSSGKVLKNIEFRQEGKVSDDITLEGTKRSKRIFSTDSPTGEKEANVRILDVEEVFITECNDNTAPVKVTERSDIEVEKKLNMKGNKRRRIVGESYLDPDISDSAEFNSDAYLSFLSKLRKNNNNLNLEGNSVKNTTTEKIKSVICVKEKISKHYSNKKNEIKYLSVSDILNFRFKDDIDDKEVNLLGWNL
ncbi:hypothetical protein HK099_000653 [Clydaea vesicula]|uniref:Shelterin complex subunit TPP1/Est3 domain-containing protein n=1 Tax=Clydaea vesicula TaxID=447962 RepID=A0AAD5XZZ3_9FUNG|nr:hypothetical protein HK099_000653 [Clydaea vesicula]